MSIEDARSVWQQLQRQSLSHQSRMDTQFDQMLEVGVVKPAIIEWASNVALA